MCSWRRIIPALAGNTFFQSRDHRVAARIIPALAGNTVAEGESGVGGWDHPRSRGEYTAPWLGFGNSWGSSPLSRGIPGQPSGKYSLPGIIPALAGNTFGSRPLRRLPADHPRSRGEYPLRQSRTSAIHGSSPLSRGILDPERNLGLVHGIIPALAGNTCSATGIDNNRPDHPRSRGEYGGQGHRCLPKIGSSPLSRGIPHEGHCSPPNLGIIPALAGNTLAVWAVSRVIRDHPRSRGEYGRKSDDEEYNPGSSPLSRGILCTLRHRQVDGGIIPALAGNTRGRSGCPGSTRDHPRSRGEYNDEVLCVAG